jgi:D-hydroxyproline dehydrogenase subunit alpha
MKHHFETLVVGSGPAGIAAAVSAAEHPPSPKYRVGLIDDNPGAGGQIWRNEFDMNERSASRSRAMTEWRRRLQAVDITHLQGWSIFDQPSPNTLRAEKQGEARNLHFENLILATGARERFLPIPGWTLPNVMGVGAIQAMVKGGLPIYGKRVVIAGSGPLLLAVAASLKAAGALVVCVCEQASLRQLLPFALSLAGDPGKMTQGLSYKTATWKIPFHTSSWVARAIGDRQLRSVEIRLHGRLQQISCDYLACGFHLVPNIELAALLECNVVDGAVKVNEWQQTTVPHIFCAGELTGIGGLELSLVEGQIAGLSAVAEINEARKLFKQKRRLSRFAARMSKAFALRPELKALPSANTLLCRCEDVSYGTVCGYDSWRAAKLHTRCGMGPCQGRICRTATEFLLGWNSDSVRPPVLPALISSLASSGARDEFHEQE